MLRYVYNSLATLDFKKVFLFLSKRIDSLVQLAEGWDGAKYTNPCLRKFCSPKVALGRPVYTINDISAVFTQPNQQMLPSFFNRIQFMNKGAARGVFFFRFWWTLGASIPRNKMKSNYVLGVLPEWCYIDLITFQQSWTQWLASGQHWKRNFLVRN